MPSDKEKKEEKVPPSAENATSEASSTPGRNSNGTSNHDLPFAKELWEACDRLRGSVESAEYKHLVLGLVFLKYISDSFERPVPVNTNETPVVRI